MSGFFGTFVMLVVAMAWAQWLTTRVPWAPRVVYLGAAVWMLTLIFAAASFTGDSSVEAMGKSLYRIHTAAMVGQYAAIGTLVAMLGISLYAFTRSPAPASSPES
ncbi:MAG: hypothetical protein R3F61_17970 [Myxococcota bacterium]